MAEVLDTQLTKPTIQRLAIIGLGLIGSSIVRGARERNVASQIIAADASEVVRRRVQELGIADRVASSSAEAVTGADLVVVCAPVGVSGEIAREIAPHLKPSAIVSDVGSVKSGVIEAMRPHLPANVHLVPAHPVAGTEHSGPDAGFGDLFENRWCILTPAELENGAAIQIVKAFWERLGSNVEIMTAQHHDLVLAITSHVPHLIAYNIVGTAADMEAVTRSEVIKFSAGGFRDFTRIAASDPTMWRDIFLHNKPAVLEMLRQFNRDLATAQQMIENDDGPGLFQLFSRTRAIRRGIIESGQETAAPDFGRRLSSGGIDRSIQRE